MQMPKQMLDPSLYRFPAVPSWIYLRQLLRAYDWRGFVKQFRYQYRRPFSRGLFERHAPSGFGIELGVGEFSVAPLSRTVLTDGFRNHGTVQTTMAQFYCRADNIPAQNDTFSYVASEHVLEHLANPIAAIEEWKRVLKPGGRILIWLPHRDRTFDRERPRTLLSHLEEDYRSSTKDDDRAHLDEWKALVIERGLAPHYGAIPLEEHPANGILHHHVWITEDVCELLRSRDLKILESFDLCPDRTDSFVVVAEKA